MFTVYVTYTPLLHWSIRETRSVMRKQPAENTSIPFLPAGVEENAYLREVSEAFREFLSEEICGNFCPETRLFERIELARARHRKDYERLLVK